MQLQFMESSKIYKYSATLRKNTESPLLQWIPAIKKLV